jgi:simple sugar transport system permease protein
VIGILATIWIYLLIRRTPLGYEIRALGSNPVASRFKGTNIPRLILVVMLISGGLAGLAGAGELFGVQHRLRLNISPGYGFTGMLVAMLANLNPIIVLPVALFFGALNQGAIQMQIITQVPTALANAIQAVVLLFLLSAQVLARYRIRRVFDVN